MRILRAKALLVLAVAPLAMAHNPASAGRDWVRPYVGSGVAVADMNVISGPECFGGPLAVVPDEGSACAFTVITESTVDFIIDDATGDPISGRYDIETTTGTISGYFCGSATGVSVPSNHQSISVSILANPGSPTCPNAGIPTTGTVTFHLY
jgi:hypothetical protein